jgi:hypothetical protein
LGRFVPVIELARDRFYVVPVGRVTEAAVVERLLATGQAAAELAQELNTFEEIVRA